MASYDEEDQKEEDEEDEENDDKDEHEDEDEDEDDDDDDDDDKNKEEIEIKVVQQPAKTSARGRGRGRGKGRGRGNQKQKATELEQAVVRQAKTPMKKKPLSRKRRLAVRGKRIRELMGPLGKLHNNVVHIRSSANRTTWFKSKARKVIPLDNRTRWNSWFNMLSVAFDVVSTPKH